MVPAAVDALPIAPAPGAAAKKPVELAWKLGDRVRVRAERIDPMRRRVEFSLVPTPPV